MKHYFCKKKDAKLQDRTNVDKIIQKSCLAAPLPYSKLRGGSPAYGCVEDTGFKKAAK